MLRFKFSMCMFGLSKQVCFVLLEMILICFIFCRNMFCLVETIEDSERIITGVPRTWVHTDASGNNNILLWPNNRKNVTTLIKRLVPPQDNWGRSNCTIIKDCILTYEGMRQEENKRSFYSDTESEREHEKQKQTQRRFGGRSNLPDYRDSFSGMYYKNI